MTLLELGKGGSLQSSRERPNQHTKVQARNISTRSQIHICLLRSQEDKKKKKRQGDVDDDDGINWLDGEDCGLGRARSWERECGNGRHGLDWQPRPPVHPAGSRDSPQPPLPLWASPMSFVALKSSLPPSVCFLRGLSPAPHFSSLASSPDHLYPWPTPLLLLLFSLLPWLATRRQSTLILPLLVYGWQPVSALVVFL